MWDALEFYQYGAPFIEQNTEHANHDQMNHSYIDNDAGSNSNRKRLFSET